MRKVYEQDLGEGWQLRHVFSHVDHWRLESLQLRQPKNRQMRQKGKQSVVAWRTPLYADPDVLMWTGSFEAYARATDSDHIPLAAQLLGTVWSLPGPTGLIRVLGFEAKLELAREVGDVPDVDR